MQFDLPLPPAALTALRRFSEAEGISLEHAVSAAVCAFLINNGFVEFDELGALDEETPTEGSA